MNIQRISRFLNYCADARKTAGVVPTCLWVFATAQLNLNIAKPNALSVRPRSLRHPVKLRARTSDPFVFRQIIIEQEYLPLNDLPIATIIDLGANIGLASAWFLNHFPEASVFAVEADLDNFEVCSANLAAYGSRAQVLHGAAWSSTEILTLNRRSCEADNQVTAAKSEGGGAIHVQGWDVASLIDKSGFDRVDLLKIDIEGAEEEVFGADVSRWLPRVRNLCIELHGQACRDVFFASLKEYDFLHFTSGELDIFTGLRLRSTA